MPTHSFRGVSGRLFFVIAERPNCSFWLGAKRAPDMSGYRPSKDQTEGEFAAPPRVARLALLVQRNVSNQLEPAL